MDDLNNAFNWRWMLDSVQPQGPTGGSVGALFKDMRDSMKGGPGGNVDKAFAMNKALRDENVAYGNSLGDLEKENDKHNLAWANFAESQNKTKGALEGHRSSWMQNYSDAVAKGDKARMDLLEQQAVSLFGNNALQTINEGKMVANKAKEQNYNYDKIMESLPSTDRKFDNPDQRNNAIAIVNQAEKDGEITREQATKARTHINSIPDWATINLNMSKQAHSQNRVNKSVENENLKDKDKWIEEYAKKYPGHTPDYYEERYKKAHKL